MTVANSQLHAAIKQIEFARQYTFSLLEDIEDELWFRQPTGCETHVGWQVAHLAMAEYGLALFRIRGRQTVDKELMPSRFRKQFSKGSAPDPNPDNNPSPPEIREVFNRVHAQVLEELPTLTDEQLSEPIDAPHAVTATKLGALFFCSHHEMLHAGQIGLLRRLLGKPPVR